MVPTVLRHATSVGSPRGVKQEVPIRCARPEDLAANSWSHRGHKPMANGPRRRKISEGVFTGQGPFFGRAEAPFPICRSSAHVRDPGQPRRFNASGEETERFMPVVSRILGHSSIGIMVDTYVATS